MGNSFSGSGSSVKFSYQGTMKNENRKVFAVMKDSTKINGILLNIVLFIMIGLLAILTYWNLYPYDIVDWKIDHYQTTKDVYVVGETLTYRTAFCKKGDYVAQQIRRLQDGVVYLFPDLTSSTQAGCLDFISTSTTVPNVPEGEYFFQVEFVYKVNPIREIHYTMQSNWFMIERAD